jgi:hypothetical protein
MARFFYTEPIRVIKDEADGHSSMLPPRAQYASYSIPQRALHWTYLSRMLPKTPGIKLELLWFDVLHDIVHSQHWPDTPNLAIMLRILR